MRTMLFSSFVFALNLTVSFAAEAQLVLSVPVVKASKSRAASPPTKCVGVCDGSASRSLIAWGSSVDYGYTVLIYDNPGQSDINASSTSNSGEVPDQSTAALGVKKADALGGWPPGVVEFRGLARDIFASAPGSSSSLAESAPISSSLVTAGLDGLKASFGSALSGEVVAPQDLFLINQQILKDINQVASSGFAIDARVALDPLDLPSHSDLEKIYPDYYRSYFKALKDQGRWPYVLDSGPSQQLMSNHLEFAMNVGLRSGIQAATRYRAALAKEHLEFQSKVSEKRRRLESLFDISSELAADTLLYIPLASRNAGSSIGNTSSTQPPRGGELNAMRDTSLDVMTRISNARVALRAATPLTQGQERAVTVAEQAFDLAVARSSVISLPSDSADVKFLVDFGVDCVDVALGFNPVTGFFKDSYEFATGLSLLTGRELSDDERLVAAIGIITISVGSKIINGASVLAKVANDSEIAARIANRASKIVPQLSFLRRGSAPLQGDYSILKIRGSPEVNSDFTLGFVPRGIPLAVAPEVVLPFQGLVADIAYRSPKALARVSSSARGNLLSGRYLVDRSDIEGLSAIQVRDRLNLSYLPDRISNVVVPPRTVLTIGEIAPALLGTEHGTRQFISSIPLDSRWITSTEVLR